jgi:hypothetical protein
MRVDLRGKTNAAAHEFDKADICALAAGMASKRY